jgi:hypothetical protein
MGDDAGAAASSRRRSESMKRQPDAGSPNAAAIVLHECAHFTMTYDVHNNILVMKRTNRLIESLRGYQLDCERMMELIPQNADVRGIVVDMRDARARQDRAYEMATREICELTFATYSRVAMLFRSAAGALQMRRFAGDRGDKLLSTTVEADAIAFASRRT